MSERAEFQVTLRSPRWGIYDVYHFQLYSDQMKIEKIGAMSYAVCTFIGGQDPIWSGSQPPYISGQPLLSILEDDSIYPPSIFIGALEHAWHAWRNNELDAAQMETEIAALFKWVENPTDSAPRTDFWRSIY